MLCCVSLFARDFENNLCGLHADINLSRGEEQFRSNVITKEMGLSQESNSNQYIEFMGYARGNQHPDSEFTKTKSFLIGTNSNLVKYPNVFAGISLGNLKSHFKSGEDRYMVRSLGFNYLIGYNYNNTLLISKFGYNKSKNVLNNNNYKTHKWIAGAELGHIHKIQENSRIYPFVEFNFEKNTPTSGAGVNFMTVIKEKIQLNTTAKWGYKFKKDKRYNAELGAQLGYFFDPDFLVTLGYRYIFARNYNYDLASIGLSHNF